MALPVQEMWCNVIMFHSCDKGIESCHHVLVTISPLEVPDSGLSVNTFIYNYLCRCAFACIMIYRFLRFPVCGSSCELKSRMPLSESLFFTISNEEGIGI
jgi:hypothetical protein